jgi:hypothetical protein
MGSDIGTMATPSLVRTKREASPLKEQVGWVLVAHACNPSYSGGRDQEDQGSKPDGQIVLETLSRKKNHHKKGLVEWLKV